jgi:hypothetical protein
MKGLPQRTATEKGIASLTPLLRVRRMART